MENATEFMVETLESRKMLAGDVSVSVAGGDLRITGDDAGNELVISSSGNPGEYRIVGGNGTTINGLAELTVSGVNDDIRIDLKDGNDRIGLVDVTVPDDLRVRTGDGDDVFVMTGSTVLDDVDLRTGDGDDHVHVLTSEVTDRLNIRTEDGNDEILLVADARRGNINSGNDSDKVAIYFSNFQTRLTVNLGSGDDLGFDDGNTGVVRMNGGRGFDARNPDATDFRSFEADDVEEFFGVTSTNTTEGTVSVQLNLARA